jgi:hypothetical protein
MVQGDRGSKCEASYAIYMKHPGLGVFDFCKLRINYRGKTGMQKMSVDNNSILCVLCSSIVLAKGALR